MSRKWITLAVVLLLLVLLVFGGGRWIWNQLLVMHGVHPR